MNCASKSNYSWFLNLINFKSRHWYSLVRIEQHFYNLDSNLDFPEIIGGKENLVDYILEIQKIPDNVIILVYDDVYKNIFETDS